MLAQRIGLAPVLLCLLLAVSPTLTRAESLVGIWGSERVLGPQVKGELTLGRDGKAWSGSIAGLGVQVRVDGRKVSGVLPGGQGEFRGILAEGGQRISGHWIQPKVRMSGMKFATPVVLRALQANVRRGLVAPLEDRFALYVVV
jgi:hypothetical protein